MISWNIELISYFAFSVVLGHPTGGATLSENNECNVIIANDIAPSVISFDEQNIETTQSKEVVKIRLNRSQGTIGK